MTNKEAATILINYFKPPIIRNDGKSVAHLLALEAIDLAIEALEAEPTKHGHWNDDNTCSRCGKEPLTEFDVRIMNYCPNCGAIMDK